jgi:hypothetical protein
VVSAGETNTLVYSGTEYFYIHKIELIEFISENVMKSVISANNNNVKEQNALKM